MKPEILALVLDPKACNILNVLNSQSLLLLNLPYNLNRDEQKKSLEMSLEALQFDG